MPALEPGIHVFLVRFNEGVDGRAFASPKRLRPRRRVKPKRLRPRRRVKPGHDD